VVGIIYIFNKPGTVEAGWYNEGWAYRQSIAITNAGTAQTNFQLEVLSDENLSSLSPDKLQADLDDLRFTDILGNILPYWIEDNTISSVNIWIKIPTVHTTGTTIYMYYGNPSAIDDQSGDDTFEFFDDFDSLDTGKWSASGSGYSFSSGVVSIYGSDYTPLISNKSFSNDSLVVRSKLKRDAAGDFDSGYYFAYVSNNNGIIHVLDSTDGGGNCGMVYPTWATEVTSYTGEIPLDSWQITEMWRNGTTVYSSALGEQISAIVDASYNNRIALFSDSDDGSRTASFDYILVRKFASTDPTAGTPASEEKGPGPVAYWKFDEGVSSTCEGGSNDACDSTTSGNDGNVVNMTWQPEDMCISGKCLQSDSSGDYITVSTTNFNPDAGTFEAWLKPTFDFSCVSGSSIYINDLMIFRNSGGSNPWYLYINDRCNLVMIAAGGTRVSSATLTWQRGVWHHVVWTWDASGSEIFVDGTSIATGTGLNSQTFGGETRIGYGHDGFIDEVKMYSYLRTDAQIKSDYLAGQSGSPSGVSASFGGGQQQDESEGLVGYWNMDEASGNAVDSSGNNNTGTPTGTTVVGGKYGNGRSFNGTSDYVNVGDLDVLEFGENSFTLSAWFNRTGDSPGDSNGGALITKGAWSSDPGYALYVGDASDDLGFQIRRADGDYYATNAGTVIDGQWYQATAVRDAVNKKGYLYLNGILVGSYDEDIIYDTTNSYSVRIGALDVGSREREFYGKIDDVKIYNIARTADQIIRDYKQGPGPVGYWSLEENTGSIAYDKSGNSYNGTIQAGTEWSLGKYGSAGDFNGVAVGGPYDSVDITTIGTKLQPLYAVSVGAWVYKRGGAWSLSRYSSSSRVSYGIADSLVRMHFDTAGGKDINISYASDEWHYIYLTYDNSSMKAYVDGILQGQIDSIDDDIYYSSGYGLYLGRFHNYNYGGGTIGGDYFDGKIDDVKIYNYARTQEQILWDMHGDESPHPTTYWNFDEGYGSTAKNTGISSYDAIFACAGTCTNDITWETGNFSRAVHLDGSDDYIYSSSADFNTEQGSVSMWVNKDNFSATHGLWTYYPADSHRIRVAVDGNKNITYYSSSSLDICNRTIVSGTPSTTWNSGEWHHIVTTWDYTNDVYQIYFDGSLVSRDNDICVAPALVVGSDDLQIGALKDNDNTPNQYYHFDGLIDGVKIFGFPLSPEQIQQEYNQGSQAALGQQKDSSETWDAGGFGGDAPVAYWNFEEGSGSTVYDKSSNSNNGTLINMEDEDWKLGKIGSGLNFDGGTSSEGVEVADHSSLKPTAITVEAWVKMTDDTARRQLFLTKWDGYSCETDTSHRPFFRIANGGDSPLGTALIMGEWYHFVGVYDPSGGAEYQGNTLYINGKRVGTTTSSTAITHSTNILTIGKYVGGYYWGGDMDEAKVFNYARTSAQVAYDYNGGKPVGWWPIDDGEGTTAIDISGNGNDGTLSMDPANDWLDGTSCKYEGCLDFDGVNDYVQLLDHATANELMGDQFSVSAWFTSEDTSGDSDARIITRDASDYWAIYVNQSQAYPQDLTFNYDNDSAATLTDQVVDSGWHHVAATWNMDTNSVKLYYDGVEMGSYTESGFLTSSRIVVLGGNAEDVPSPTTSPWDGKLDDARIYNYELTAEQVKEVMNNGSVYLK
jgi:Concanavalin A-like lectin/glucanases superfamily/Domain of unknown function (DUF2341)